MKASCRLASTFPTSSTSLWLPTIKPAAWHSPARTRIVLRVTAYCPSTFATVLPPAWAETLAPTPPSRPLDTRIPAVRHPAIRSAIGPSRSEEHTSELQSHLNIVCRLLLEKKK